MPHLPRRLKLSAALALVLSASLPIAAVAADQTISGVANGSTLSVSASGGQYAGAIDSVSFRGVQYVNDVDHGQSFQADAAFNGYGQCLNPTEAGSQNDGSKSTSTSQLLSIGSSNGVLTTSTNMAFWLAPGQANTSNGTASALCNKNDIKLGSTSKSPALVSGDVISKTVSIGLNGIPNIISVTLSFYMPNAYTFNDSNSNLTPPSIFTWDVYLKPAFSMILYYDPINKALLNFPNAQPYTSGAPLIAAYPNGQNALSVFSNAIYPSNPNYGSFVGQLAGAGATATTFLSCGTEPGPIAAGTTYTLSCPMAIGTVDEVVAAMNAYYAPNNSEIQVYRFMMTPNYPQKYFYTTTFTEGATGGPFSFSETAFTVYPANYNSGYVPLYRCRAGNGDYFASLLSNCEGQTAEAIFGYISPTAAAGLVPLYRYDNASIGTHLITKNQNDATSGFVLEGVLGYVPTE